MSKTIKLAEVAVTFRRYADRFSKAARKAEADSADEAVEIAQRLSSGPFKAYLLRRRGHPYRLGGRPPIHPGIINEQSGTFKKAWKARPPRQHGNRLQTKVVNDTPYARFLFRGTKRMIARPLERLLRDRLAKKRAAIWNRALRSWLQGD